MITGTKRSRERRHHSCRCLKERMSYWSSLVRQPFDSVSSPDDIHERHARDLSDAPAELAVARCDNVTPVGGHPLHETVVGVRARMRTC